MELQRHAEALPINQRRKIIMDYSETELHGFLKELFQAMEPNYTIEITHGTQEFGKDLVIVKSDKFSHEAIGVVVKCGNIKAKTLGDVDSLKKHVDEVLPKTAEKRLGEIKSQLQQALAHPAKMKSILEDLPISKVFVVLAGEFSNNAQIRLTKELVADIEIFDIDWLVSSFTKFYPQIFFQGRTIDFIEKQIHKLEENHGRRKSGTNLSKYFVDPVIRQLNNPFQLSIKNPTRFSKQKKLPFSRLTELCKKAKKLVLLGNPGTGKTGAIAKLAIDMYRDARNQLLKKPPKSNKKIPVPIFVSARELLESELEKGFLETYFEFEGIHSHFEVDIIMVDGLDEIESEKRTTLISKLDTFSDEISCSYILTSRKIDIINTLPEKYQKYELHPFEFQQALQLFSKLIHDNKIMSDVTEILKKIHSQMFLVPLSLMLLIELVEEHQEVPASLTELYERFFDMVLGREDQDKEIAVLFDYLSKKKFLSALAYYEFWEKNRLGIPREDFAQFLDSYAAQYGWSSEKLDDFVLEIERAGILDHRDKVNFKHRSFLEYFAAFHVYENREDIKDLNDLIVNTYFDDIWNEVSFFYIGLRREISHDLLESIYSYKDDALMADFYKLLGGRLLQAGWHSPVEQHVYGIEQAIRYAPRIRKRFQEIITSSNLNVPNIMSDFIVLILADFSFNSGFLRHHTEKILEKLTISKSQEDIYMAVVLLGAIRRFLSPNKVKEYINYMLGGLSSSSSPEEQARILLLMQLIEEDREIIKLIKRHTNRLKKKSPEAFRALLPATQKGF